MSKEKKEIYLGGEKQEEDYCPKDFTIYFIQLFKKIFNWGKKK